MAGFIDGEGTIAIDFLAWFKMFENKYLKPVNLLKTVEEVAKFRSDLENSTQEAFKRIDKNKRETLVESHNYLLD